MTSWLALLLGAASAAYLTLRPAGLGFPLPTLDGQLTLRPTFGRITGYLCGRWSGALLLGLIGPALGAFLPTALFARLIYSLCALMAFFMFQFLATEHSPEFPLAKLSNPAGLRWPTFWLGLLSVGTLFSPTIIGMMYFLVQGSLAEGLIFGSYFFCGHALCSLPVLLNLSWVRNPWYTVGVKGLIFFCAVIVLISSVNNFLKT
jgi:hypothetical protein